MAEYYKTNFTVENMCSDPDVQGIELMSGVQDTVCEWAARRRVEAYEEKDDGGWQSENGASLIVDKGELGSSGFRRLVLEHRDENTEATTWRSDFRFATEGESVDAEIEVRRIYEGDEVSNTQGHASRPNVLIDLFQNFKCSSDGNVLTTESQHIKEQDADWFVSTVLTNSARRIPAVVVVENFHGGIFINPNHLQSRLLGLANVFTYDNPTARFITRQTGERLGCWDGTIRAYRPGCTLEDASRQNAYWTWGRMSFIIARQGWDQLLTEIADECLRHSLPQAGQRLYDAVSLQVNQAQSQRLLEMIKEPDIDESTYNELLNNAANNIEGLRRQNDELRQRLVELESEKVQLRSEVEQLGVALSYQESEDPEPPDASEDLQPEFNSVHDVVRYAEDQLTGMRIFSIAKEMAKGSQFPRPEEVYEVFQALENCAIERRRGPLGRDVREWLSDRGIAYSPHESQTTMGKHGDKRKFHDNVTKDRIVMEEHIKLGGGLGEHNQLRIHLKWDDNEAQWLIGYIGRHLPTASG